MGVNITTWVLRAVSGDCKSSMGHVVIEPSTYNRVWRELERDENMVIVGWYHSHPNMGIFLSGTDVRNMKLFHYKPYQIAIVIDPIRNDIGVFGWQKGKLKCLGVLRWQKGKLKCLRENIIDIIIFHGDYKQYFRGRYGDSFSWERKDIILERVCISKEACDAIIKHAKQGALNEIGGYLIGKPSIIGDERDGR